jgi:hypothetical protein
VAWHTVSNIVATPLNSSGAGVGFIRNDNAAVLLVIGQLSVITKPTSSGATCTITPPIGIVDTSYFAGTGDVAWGLYWIEPGSYLQLTWASGPANGVGVCSYFGVEVIE